MDIKTIKSTLIYQEMDTDIARAWFNYKLQKFITHVDNLYYNITVEGNVKQLISDLSRLRQKTIQSGQPQMIQADICISEQGTLGYPYCLTKPNEFDVFINETASMIQVQLRAKGIWLNGLEQTFNSSLSAMKSIFEPYNIRITDITESRLDIAHHTNYFQDFNSSFKEENLAAMQISRLKRYIKQGNLRVDSAIADYVALGNRSYVYVRIYIKSKEVIKMHYKQFFIPIWLENGLISKFDKFIFDDIFDNAQSNFEYRHVSRCRFYLKYGQDESIKNNIRLLSEKKGASYSEYEKLADTCVPDLTVITNVEFQVGRRFTKDITFPNIDLQVDQFTGEVTASVPDSEKHIRTIIKVIPNIRRLLTTRTIRFVKYKGRFRNMEKSDRPNDEWWKRLVSCDRARINANLSRKYQKNADIQRLKIRTINSMASFSAHSGLIDDLPQGDMYSFVDSLNDNDLQMYDTSKNKALSKIDSIPNFQM